MPRPVFFRSSARSVTPSALKTARCLRVASVADAAIVWAGTSLHVFRGASTTAVVAATSTSRPSGDGVGNASQADSAKRVASARPRRRLSREVRRTWWPAGTRRSPRSTPSSGAGGLDGRGSPHAEERVAPPPGCVRTQTARGGRTTSPTTSRHLDAASLQSCSASVRCLQSCDSPDNCATWARSRLPCSRGHESVHVPVSKACTVPIRGAADRERHIRPS
jgi:hypothetical protein